MMSQLKALVSDEKGIQHAEEALLLALIAVALGGAAVALRTGISDVFGDATTCMNSSTAATAC